MTLLVSDPSARSLGRFGASEDDSNPRYDFLATSIIGALASGGGMSLVVRDSSLDSAALRTKLEGIDDKLLVLELPCARRRACAQVIPGLAELVASNFLAAEAGRGEAGTALVPSESPRLPVLLLCDDAERLDDDQLEAIYRLAAGEHGPLGVILLASTQFLERLRHPQLQHVRAALSACLWSQRASYGGVCVEGPPGDGEMPDYGRFDLAALPAIIEDEAEEMRDDGPAQALASASLRGLGSEHVPSAFIPPPRTPALARLGGLFLLLALVAAELLLVYLGWNGSPWLKGDAMATASAKAAPGEMATDMRAASAPASEKNDSDALSTAALADSGSDGATDSAAAAPATEPGHLAASAAAGLIANVPLPPPPTAIAAIPEPAPNAPDPADIPLRKPEPTLHASDASDAAPPEVAILPPDKPSSAPAAPIKDASAPPASIGEPSAPAAPTKDASAPAAPSNQASAPARLAPADIASFVERGNALLASGDIASARLFFERAADAGDSRAALGMAQSYDPALLQQAGVQGVTGDRSKADFWYQRARLLAASKNPSSSQKDSSRD